MDTKSLDEHPAIKLMSSNGSVRRFNCTRNGRELKVMIGKGNPLHYFVSITTEEIERKRQKLENPPYPYDEETFRYYPTEHKITYLRSSKLPSFVYDNDHTVPVTFEVKEPNDWMIQTLNQLYEVLKLGTR